MAPSTCASRLMSIVVFPENVVSIGQEGRAFYVFPGGGSSWDGPWPAPQGPQEPGRAGWRRCSSILAPHRRRSSRRSPGHWLVATYEWAHSGPRRGAPSSGSGGAARWGRSNPSSHRPHQRRRRLHRDARLGGPAYGAQSWSAGDRAARPRVVRRLSSRTAQGLAAASPRRATARSLAPAPDDHLLGSDAADLCRGWSRRTRGSHLCRPQLNHRRSRRGVRRT
jgi:hypothetical protein